MKRRFFIGLRQWIILTGLLGAAGCATTTDSDGLGNSRVVKQRGVYTTVAVSGENLDMPGSGYTSCSVFAPGQTPAAVVLGCDVSDLQNPNSSQVFQLQVVETASGAILQDLSGQVFAGKAAVFDLPIRKSGNYRLKLIINGSVYDTWDFTVNRDVAANTGVKAGQSPAYAKGNFSVSVEGIQTDAFMQYDDVPMMALNDAVQKELNHMAGHDDFIQISSGHVVIQFDLSAAGAASAAKIIENTLSEEFGRFYLRVLQNGAPYKAWPNFQV